jgi:hypothetical protein
MAYLLAVFFFVLLCKTQKNTHSFTTFCIEINVLNIIKGRSSLFSEDFKRSDHETYNYFSHITTC